MDAHARPSAQPVMTGETPRELCGPIGVFAVHVERVRRAGRHQRGRGGSGSADAAEPAAAATTQIKYAEVQTCMRLDEHLLAGILRKNFVVAGHTGFGRAGDDFTNCVSSAIASASRGPAVLSTITCRRSSSLSMKVR